MAFTKPKTETCTIYDPVNDVERTAIFTIYPSDPSCGIFNEHIELDDVLGMPYDDQEKYSRDIIDQIYEYLEYLSTQTPPDYEGD
jgi:hypothetical protein